MRYRQLLCHSDTVMCMETVKRHHTSQEGMLGVDARELAIDRRRKDAMGVRCRHAQWTCDGCQYQLP